MLFLQLSLNLVQNHILQIDSQEQFQQLLEETKKPVLAFLFNENNYEENMELQEEYNQGYNHYGYIVDAIKVDCNNFLLEKVCSFFITENNYGLYLYSQGQIYIFRQEIELTPKQKQQLEEIRKRRLDQGDEDIDYSENHETIREFLQKNVKSNIMELQFKSDIQKLVKLNESIILMWTSRMKSSQVHYKIAQKYENYQLYVIIYFNQNLINNIEELKQYDFDEESYGLIVCKNGLKDKCKQYFGDNVLDDMIEFIDKNQ